MLFIEGEAAGLGLVGLLEEPLMISEMVISLYSSSTGPGGGEEALLRLWYGVDVPDVLFIEVVDEEE